MSAQPLTPGTRVGRYEVVAHLASGGMGEVYKARDRELGRDVALKVLPDHLANNPTSVERFRREARAAARLSHKNIVTLYDWGQHGGTWFLALEFVDGTDLGSRIAGKGHLDSEEAWIITIQAAKALDHAFRQGVVHRDVKPSNFLLTRQGKKLRVKLTDLGVARAIRDEDFRITRDGTTVGTIDYLAPEQARDSALADVRSDIYSLGCTLYHMLTGQPPFPDGGLGERIYKHMQVDPADVRDLNPEVPDGLWMVLRRMLAKRPEERYQTPGELLEALLRLRAADPGAAPARATEEASPDDSVVRLAGARPATEGNTPPPRQRVRTAEPAPPPRIIDPAPAVAALGVTEEQRQVAAGQFERAAEVLASASQDKGYAYDLLLTCCKLDPTNTTYRRRLRQAAQEVRQRQGLGRWMGSLTAFAAKTRLRTAKHAGNYRKVLDCGEEVLARAPEDVATQLDMADAAEALGLIGLHIWLLEQACKLALKDPEPLRRLAVAYEKQQDLDRAIVVWQSLRKLWPHDSQAARKINALSIKETIIRGNYDDT
jgi:tetratricopeptide (TPR) repeat protein